MEKWVKDLVESELPNKLVIGHYYIINEKPAKLVGGTYWGTYGISNFWYWKYIDTGRLSRNKVSGYGGSWKQITKEEAYEISKKNRKTTARVSEKIKKSR